MRIDILTIFPGMFTALTESIVKRAMNAGQVRINITDLRDFARNKHRSVDDYPYGGGPGMVMQAEPFFLAVEHLQNITTSAGKVILLSPRGQRFTQQKAVTLAKEDHLILLCGHYEGIDERVQDALVDEEISVGDFVLTGGEIPAMVVTDAVVRLLPGVLPQATVAEESFMDGLLEYPQYTRPAEIHGLEVPAVLLSGDHAKIREWRRKQSLLLTLTKRPELLQQVRLSDSERQMLLIEATKRNLDLLL